MRGEMTVRPQRARGEIDERSRGEKRGRSGKNAHGDRSCSLDIEKRIDNEKRELHTLRRINIEEGLLLCFTERASRFLDYDRYFDCCFVRE